MNAPWGEEDQRCRVTQIPVSTSSRSGGSLIFPSHDQSVSRGLLCVQPAWLQAGHYQLSIVLTESVPFPEPHGPVRLVRVYPVPGKVQAWIKLWIGHR